MSTEYELMNTLKRGAMQVEEHSNLLDLVIYRGADDLSLNDLSPEEVENIALNLLQIASYWGGKKFDELKLPYRNDLIVRKE